MTELKPCPFCRGEAEIWIEYIKYGSRKYGYDEMNAYHCGCKKCGISMRSGWSEEDAIEAWNRRTTNE